MNEDQTPKTNINTTLPHQDSSTKDSLTQKMEWTTPDIKIISVANLTKDTLGSTSDDTSSKS